MPENYTTTVTARDLRKGDKITGKDGDHVVETVSPKQKYVHVKMEGSDKIGYFQKEQPFEVTRTRLTKEEQAKENIEDALFTLDRDERRDRRRLKEAREVMAKAMAAGKHISWHEMEALVMAQELERIWNSIKSTHRARNGEVIQAALDTYEMTGGSYSEAEDNKREFVTRFDAVKAMRATLMMQIVKNTDYAHRSTSAASNLFEWYRLTAQAKWVEEREWDVASVIGTALR